MSSVEEYNMKLDVIKGITDDQLKETGSIPIGIYIQEAEFLYTWCHGVLAAIFMGVPLGRPNLAVRERENIPKVPIGSFRTSEGPSIYPEGHAPTSSELCVHIQYVIYNN